MMWTCAHVYHDTTGPAPTTHEWSRPRALLRKVLLLVPRERVGAQARRSLNPAFRQLIPEVVPVHACGGNGTHALVEVDDAGHALGRAGLAQSRGGGNLGRDQVSEPGQTLISGVPSLLAGLTPCSRDQPGSTLRGKTVVGLDRTRSRHLWVCEDVLFSTSCPSAATLA
jgi:hypothetical protein